MAGPSGFIQRWKGKVAVAAAYFGGVQEFGAGSLFVGTTAGAQTIPATNGAASIASSSAISIWTIGAIPQAGAELEIALISVSSGVFIKAAAGTSFDPSTDTVMKSTGARTITLYGLSSLKWAIKSVFPGDTVGNISPTGITLTTTT